MEFSLKDPTQIQAIQRDSIYGSLQSIVSNFKKEDSTDIRKQKFVCLLDFLKTQSREENEFLVSSGDNVAEFANLGVLELFPGIVKLDNGNLHKENELVNEYLSVEKIEPWFFWEEIYKRFPLVAVSSVGIPNKRVVNQVSFHDAKRHGIIQAIQRAILRTESPKILEIGSGHGAIFLGIQNHLYDGESPSRRPNCYCDFSIDMSKYYTLDIVRNGFTHPNHFVGNGWSIPDDVGNEFDAVISHNCFQHLHKKQIRNYIQDSFNILKSGGELCFSLFSARKEGDNKMHAQSSFFGQNIILPVPREIKTYATKAGYSSCDYFSTPATEKGKLKIDVWRLWK